MHTRCRKKRVRTKKEAGKEGNKKSKVPPYTHPPPDRPPTAENMLNDDSTTDDNYFEGGGVALLEYSSREGCRVDVQDSREEAGQEFGRL